MDEGIPTRYWCHMCRRTVDPIMDGEIKCPYCQNGFVEEMTSTARDDQDAESDIGSDRALSLWAPILLGMMSNPRRRRRMRRLRFDDDDDEYENDENNNEDIGASLFRHREDSELNREIESIMRRRRRRRSSATILQLLQGIRAGMVNELENADSDRDRERERNRERDGERERVLLINPFNQTIILRGSSYDSTDNSNLVGSLGDYFIGPGLDFLLQHLEENDPNRYGSPPAQKEAIEAMPTVKIKETSQCSVCLDDFVVGTEVREMPCKHKFHTGCILPWLELHSSCPVCRFQLPADESKVNPDGNGNSNASSVTQQSGDAAGNNEEAEGRNANGRRFSFPWPFSGFFGNSNSSSSSSSSANAHERSSAPTDEH